MNKEALKLAIQLRDTVSGYWTENEIPIIEKLIELLAHPAQEPVAWCSQCGHKCPLPAQEPVATLFGTLPVYDNTPPQPAQEPPQYSFKAYWAEDGRIGVVVCIIRPDGGPHIMEEFIDPPQATEKYTYGTPLLDAMTKDHVAPPPAQEPVAYLCRLDEHGLFDIPTPDKACKDCFPVYAAPPQRAWVGLTDEEIGEIHSVAEGQSVGVATGLTERKLKEKNT